MTNMSKANQTKKKNKPKKTKSHNKQPLYNVKRKIILASPTTQVQTLHTLILYKDARNCAN